MPMDVRRVIRAAVDAALEDPVPEPIQKRRLSTGRALVVGAGLMAAAKLAVSSRGQNMLGTLRHGMADLEARFLDDDDDEDVDDDHPDAELDEDEQPNGNAPATASRGRG
jgi:hypothetical protein